MTDEEKQNKERASNLSNYELHHKAAILTLPDTQVVRANWHLDGDVESNNVVSASVLVGALRDKSAQESIADAIKDSYEKGKRPEIEKLQEDYKLYYNKYRCDSELWNKSRMDILGIINFVKKRGLEPIDWSGNKINLDDLSKDINAILDEVIQTPSSDFGRGLNNNFMRDKLNNRDVKNG